MYLLDETINMDKTSIFSIIEMKNEIWFGGIDMILTYIKNDIYWKSF